MNLLKIHRDWNATFGSRVSRWVQNTYEFSSDSQEGNTMNEIDIRYRRSDDPDRRCLSCKNFQPVKASQIDGSCFGNAVTIDGLCDFYTGAPAVGTVGR